MERKRLKWEDKKAIDREIKDIIWQRDARSCKRCGKVLYQTIKPKGSVHHIDLNKHNNNASNLILLCSGCHSALHCTYRKDEYKYMWEIEVLTGVQCSLLPKEICLYRYGYHWYLTTNRIDELEHEHNKLGLPKKDVGQLEYLKRLEKRLKEAEASIRTKEAKSIVVEESEEI